MRFGIIVVVLVAGCSRPKPQLRGDAGVLPDADGALQPMHDAFSYVNPGEPVCPQPPAPPMLPAASTHSGSRLIIRTMAEPVANGVDVLWSIYDSQLGVECQPRNYVDGHVRCVPQVPQLHGEAWADPAHTIPVAVFSVDLAPSAGTLVGYATHSMDACWSDSLEFFARVGAQRQGSVYYTADGSSNTISSGYALFDLDALTPDFIALDENLATLTSEIAVRELHGPDGSSFPYGLYDVAHDVPVYDSSPGPDRRLYPPELQRLVARRQPPPSGSLSAYCGGTAAENLFAPPLCDADKLRFATAYGGGVYRVTRQYGTLWFCIFGDAPPQARPNTEAFMGTCGTVATTEWTPVSDTAIGGARITATALGIGTATFVLPSTTRWFTDVTLGTICAPQLASDGVLRCLPYFGRLAYADPACTQRVVDTAGNGAPRYAKDGTTYYSVGAARGVAPLYGVPINGTACTSYGSYASWELGAQVPASTFAQLELRQLP